MIRGTGGTLSRSRPSFTLATPHAIPSITSICPIWVLIALRSCGQYKTTDLLCRPPKCRNPLPSPKPTQTPAPILGNLQLPWKLLSVLLTRNPHNSLVGHVSYRGSETMDTLSTSVSGNASNALRAVLQNPKYILQYLPPMSETICAIFIRLRPLLNVGKLYTHHETD